MTNNFNQITLNLWKNIEKHSNLGYQISKDTLLSSLEDYEQKRVSLQDIASLLLSLFFTLNKPEQVKTWEDHELVLLLSKWNDLSYDISQAEKGKENYKEKIAIAHQELMEYYNKHKSSNDSQTNTN